MYFLLLGLIGIAWLIIFHLYVHYNERGQLVNKIPGPMLIPFFGNALSLLVSEEKINDIFREWSRIYYPIYRIWFGSKAIIHIRHPNDIEILLANSKYIYKGYPYQFFHQWLKTGLLTSGGKKWQNRRKILTNAFHFNILNKYMDITNEQGEKTIAHIKICGKETTQNLLPFCSSCTLNIICESAMGVSLEEEIHKKIAKKYKHAVYEMGNIIIKRMVMSYIKDWMLPFIPKLNNRIKSVLTDLHGFTNTIVQERREYHENTNYENLKEIYENEKQPNNYYIGKRKRLAMLDLLLSAERDGLIDDEGIKEEVATFVFEGHDTTAISMCFTILLLAENKEVQDRAREEVETILNEKKGKLETSDLQKMKYLERCIKESLRLYPSVPSVGRYITEDLQLENYRIPKGSHVLLHFYDLHRDPEFWPEPEVFDPDRFLPDRAQQRHPFSYLPFSAGVRNCIGQKFAILEQKSLISRILYNFYLEPIDYARDIKFRADIVLRPTKPVHTKFILINRH